MNFYETFSFPTSGRTRTVAKCDPNQPAGSFWAETAGADGSADQERTRPRDRVPRARAASESRRAVKK
jgi:hypothetical protein